MKLTLNHFKAVDKYVGVLSEFTDVSAVGDTVEELRSNIKIRFDEYLNLQKLANEANPAWRAFTGESLSAIHEEIEL